MAIIKDSVLFQCVEGRLGKEFVIYKRNGLIIIARKRGPSNKKPTAKQLEARAKMMVAAGYAKAILQDPEMLAYYQSKAGPGQNAWNMAIKDAYNSPEVQQIKIEDTTVVVKAKDEFRVADVEVRIFDAEGHLQERGKATLGRNGVDWSFTAASLPPGGKIKVIAEDLAGNETVRELLLEP